MGPLACVNPVEVDAQPDFFDGHEHATFNFEEGTPSFDFHKIPGWCSEMQTGVPTFHSTPPARPLGPIAEEVEGTGVGAESVAEVDEDDADEDLQPLGRKRRKIDDEGAPQKRRKIDKRRRLQGFKAASAAFTASSSTLPKEVQQVSLPAHARSGDKPTPQRAIWGGLVPGP